MTVSSPLYIFNKKENNKQIVCCASFSIIGQSDNVCEMRISE